MLLFQNWYLWRVKKNFKPHPQNTIFVPGRFFSKLPTSTSVLFTGGSLHRIRIRRRPPLVYIDLLIVSHVATWCDFTRNRSLRDWFSLRLWNSSLNSVGFTLASCCKSENRINCLYTVALIWRSACELQKFASAINFNFLDIAECFTCLADALETNNFVNCLRNKPTNYLVKWMWTGAVTS